MLLTKNRLLTMQRLDRPRWRRGFFLPARFLPAKQIDQQPWRLEEVEVLLDDRGVVPLTLLAQAGSSVCLAALLALWVDGVAALSALLGGIAAVVPNAFLAARLLVPRVGADAKAVLRSAWFGVIGKLLLTALLFGIIFALVRPLSAAAVFGGFIAAQVAVFGALLLGGGAADKELTTKS